MNKVAKIPFWNNDFISSGYRSRSGSAGSHGGSILNLLRCLPTVVHRGCTSLHPHQQCTNFTFSLHPSQHLSLVFLIIDILTGVKKYLIVVLICISLVISDIENLFMYLLVICMSSLKLYLFTFFVHVLIGLFAFLVLSCMGSFYILDINLFLDMWFANIFSHSLGWFFILFTVSFAVQLFIFAFVALTLVSKPKNHCQDQYQKAFLTMFSSSSWMVLGLTFVFNPFWVDFCL